VKAKKVFLEFIKDHLIPHIVENKYTKEMYDAFVSLYQNKNTERVATFEAPTSSCQDVQ
jgi:hypothetical protein